MILLYTFICILYGIIKIGINFFSLEIYRIRRRDTMPQALSIVSILVILMMFAFSMQLMSIAPAYVTFGDQKLADGEDCTLKESKTHLTIGADTEKFLGCQMTIIAQVYTKIQLSVPLFSLIYFIMSWVFIAFFAIFFVYHVHYKRGQYANNLRGYSSLGQDDDEELDEDLQMFIKRSFKEDATEFSSSGEGLAQRIKNDRMAERLER